jgi:hypothetical protein
MFRWIPRSEHWEPGLFCEAQKPTPNQLLAQLLVQLIVQEKNDVMEKEIRLTAQLSDQLIVQEKNDVMETKPYLRIEDSFMSWNYDINGSGRESNSRTN